MTKIPSVEEVVEAIRQRHIHLKANNPVGFVHLFADIKKAITAEREAMRKETMRTVMAQCRKLVDEPEEAIYLEEIEEMLYELDQEYLTPPTK